MRHCFSPMSIPKLLVTSIVSLLMLASCRTSPPPPPQPTLRTSQAPAEWSTVVHSPPVALQQSSRTAHLLHQYIPGGKRENSSLLLTSELPPEIVRGKPFTYTLTVTNLTAEPVYKVLVSEELGEAFDLRGSRPAAQVTGSQVVWSLGDLPPHGSQRLEVDLVGTTGGTYRHCVQVTTASMLCHEIPVTAPALAITKNFPEVVLSCEEIPVTIVVTNSGTGIVRNVRVTETLPPSLTTADGQQLFRFSVEELRAGQSVTRTLQVRPRQAGLFQLHTLAVSDGDLQAESSGRIQILQPVLTLQSRASARQFQGRSVRYDFAIANTGDGPARQTVLTNLLPPGATFLEASDGGQLRGGNVVWALGTLEPGDSRSVTMEVRADRIGRLENNVRAQAVCAEPVSATDVSDISGVAAMLMRVIDLEDPIEVGHEVVYEIALLNQGTAPATNVKIVAILEDSQSYVSSEGASTGALEKDRVVFAALPILAPGARALWRVRVKAMKPADSRFTVELTSDQLVRPVREMESTQLY